MKKNSCFYFSSLLLLTPFASVGSFLTTNHNQKINKVNAIVSSDDLQIQVNKNQTDKNKILVFATSTLDLLDKNPTIIWFCSKPTAIVFSKTESSLNEKIEILGTSNDWYKVDFNGKEGYVSSSYIKLNALEKGIDVSKWNGTIDWASVKNSGIDYVIIRAGYGTSTVDPQFKSYIEGAKKAGLKIGVYWFSYATSVEEAKQEAQSCLQTLSPYKSSINYPVFFDFEYASVDYAKKNGINITKNLVSQMANAFLSTVKSQGYTTGLYTNRNFSNTYYNTDLLYSNNLWVAQYNSTNSFGKPYPIWQYSESGKVPGISGAVDLNYTCLNTFGINLNTNSGSNSNINTGTSTPSASSEKGVTTANLNFRKSASTSSLVINTIPKNTTVEILEQLSSGWYKIKYKGLTGYVSGSYVSIKK